MNKLVVEINKPFISFKSKLIFPQPYQLLPVPNFGVTKKFKVKVIM